MTTSLLETLAQRLACAALLAAAGCTMCPGGLLVKDNMSQASAQLDAMDCSNQSHLDPKSPRAKMLKKVDREQLEREAMNECMREHGYLWIPEAVMLHPDAPPAGASCATCAHTQVGSLSAR